MCSQLAAQLAEQVMGWKTTPDRYLVEGKKWIPRWRFDPLNKLPDAFVLLERAADTFQLSLGDDGFAATVQIGNRIGSHEGLDKARTITLAVASALGLKV